jgi:serine protease Do
VLVGDVVDGGPAEKAGFQRGDVIVEFEGSKIEDPNQLRNMVANTEPGKQVKLKIFREGKAETKTVTIGELPAELQKLSRGEYDNLLKGVSVQDLTPEIYNRLNISRKIKGVVITHVDEKSPSASILTQGDVIQEIDRQKITNVKDYEKVVSNIKPGKGILLLIFRSGVSIFLTLSGG